MSMKTKKAACFGDRTAKNKLQFLSYRGSQETSSINLKQEFDDFLFCLEFPIGKNKLG